MTFSGPLSNFRTFQVLHFENSKFRTFHNFSGPVGGGSLINPDGVAPSWMVSVSASDISPCTTKSRRFPLLAQAHPGSPGKKAIIIIIIIIITVFIDHGHTAMITQYTVRRLSRRTAY